ncbi:MAG: multidrug effflux MFS transporter [Pseudomonadota bacterium]
MKLALPRSGSAPTYGMALLLASLSMVSPLSVDTFFPSFRAIASEFSLSSWEVQQLVTAYMVPFACLTLIHGPLSDALGRRRLVIVGMSLYTLASIGCVFAPTFAMLLVFRVLQGMAAGIGPTVARAVVRDLYDGSDAQRLMSAIMMIFSVAPAIGPVIGGWIHVAFGWRSVFGFMVAIGSVLALVAFFALPETHPPEKRSQFHFGKLVSTSWRIAMRGDFVLLSMSAALCMGAVLAYIGSAPAIILEQWQLQETQFWFLFVPIIGGFMISSIVAGRLAGRISRARQLRGGFALMFVASLLSLLLHLLVNPTPILPQQCLLFMMAFGAQFTFPILTLEMLDLYPTSRGAAASVQSFISLGFVSIVMGVFAPALHGSLTALAVVALGFSGLGYCAWLIASRRLARVTPPAGEGHVP